MPRSLAFLVPSLAALAAVPHAQNVHATVGPDPAPLGCSVSITASNDAPFLGSSVGCPFRVFDDQMNLVFDPGVGSPCDETPILIGPWGWVTSSWDQRDQAGDPVPPGTYVIEVTYDIGAPTFHPIEVGGAEAGLVLEGTATIFETLGGESRHFYLCSPQDPGATYFLLASFSSTVGFPTCNGNFPLDIDPLLLLSFTPGAVFQGSIGTLNASGTSKAPVFDLPENPNLVGVSLVAAFGVANLALPCQVVRISGTHAMTIVG